jgi:hypothetical protein
LIVDQNSLFGSPGNSLENRGDIQFFSLAGEAGIGRISLNSLYFPCTSGKPKMRESSSQQTPPSANQSVHFAYILEKAKTPREMWRSFSPQRTGEPLTPDSPDSASILSVRNRNGSLQHLHRR